MAAVYHRFRVGSKPSAAQKLLAADLLNGKGAVPAPDSTRKSFYMAVLSYIRSDGSIASLAHLAPAARIKAQPCPPAAAEMTQPITKIGNDDLSFHTALDIGLGILGDVHLGGDLRFCGFLSWSTYRRSVAASTMIVDEFYGAGIRASIRYSGDEIKGGATQVAAKVTVERTATSFSIDILGVDVSALPSIGAFASGAATVFDSQTLSLIGGIWSDVNGVITAHDKDDPSIPAVKKDAWRPCLTGVNLDLGADELQAIAGRCGPVAFALTEVRDGVSLAEARQAAAAAEYKAAVDDVYGGVAEPDSEARRAAKALLKIGRNSFW